MSNNNPLYLVRIASQINTETQWEGESLFFIENILVERLDIKYITTLKNQYILSISIKEVAEEAKPFLLDSLYLVKGDSILFDEFYDIYYEDTKGLERDELEHCFRSKNSFTELFSVK